MKSATQAKRLLAINFGGLGDEVLFLPTLQSIAQAHPSWHISLLTEPRARSISDVTNVIDSGIVFDIKKKPLRPGDYWHLLQLLRSGNFDLVLSSGSSPAVSMLLFLSGIKNRIGFGANPLAKRLLTNPVALNKEQHAACMYHDLVKGLGIATRCESPEIRVDAQSVKAMATLLDTKYGTTTVLMHPGTSRLATMKGVIKGWDPANWAALIRRLLEAGDYKVVLAGGPDDAETIDNIISLLKAGPGAIDQEHPNFLLAYGKTANLRDLVALIHLADLLVCVDSAPMHLGVGLKKPLVAMFGPTDPQKLLWPDKKFLSLRDAEAAARIGSNDPFKLAAQKAAQTKSIGSEPPAHLVPPYVQIPLDTVYRSLLDQLKLAANQDSSPE